MVEGVTRHAPSIAQLEEREAAIGYQTDCLCNGSLVQAPLGGSVCAADLHFLNASVRSECGRC